MNQEKDKHTPGPWEVIGCEEVRPKHSTTMIAYIGERYTDGAIDREQRKANATLIAQAPDLLAENRRLREEIKRLKNPARHVAVFSGSHLRRYDED